MTLAEYERFKFELAELLRTAVALTPAESAERKDAARELFARLAEDRFNIVVVGRFSRGKSSLMNAIMGLDRLPTGIVPLTSVITSVSYGSEPSVSLTFEGRTLRSTVTLDELPRYVTETGNPGNHLKVKIADVRLPAEILRRGFHFIDTPGLGSPTEANTRTTQAFLPAADAFLLVTSFDGPLSEDERRFLDVALPSGRRVFVAVNKQDGVALEDRARVLTYVQNELAAMPQTPPVEIYPTSALDGLAAKMATDGPRLSASGVVDLEAALLRFLVEEKSQQFLLRMCDRAAAFLTRWADGIEGADAVWTNLERIRHELGEAHTVRARDEIVGGLAPAYSENAGACEICRAMELTAFDFLSHHQYVLTIDLGEQERLARDGGLCALHTWSYHNLASPLGVSIGYPRLLERWRDRLSCLATNERVRAAEIEVEGALPTAKTCVVCLACAEAETEALFNAAERILRSAEAIDNLSAVCLRHLIRLLALVEPTEIRQALLLREAGLFERVAEDMRRYALKRDGLRRELASRAEDDAAARGAKLLAGQPNVSFVRRRD